MNTNAILRWSGVFLALSLFIILPFVIWEEPIEQMTQGILSSTERTGAFALVVAGALAGDVFLPVPSSLVSTFAGATLGWFWATLISWTGMTLGCLLGYWVGRTGGTTLLRRLVGDDELERARRTSPQTATTTLVLMRAVPVLAEVSVLAAGMVGYPLRRFLAACATANLGIAFVYGYVGQNAADAGSFLLAFAGAVLVPVVFFVLLRLVQAGRAP